MKIIDSNELIKEKGHFTYHEFFKPEFGGGKEFEMPDPLYEAQEILRDYFKQPWRVTCVLRTDIHWGFHPLGQAVDSLPLYPSQRGNILDIFSKECLKYQHTGSSELIELLRKAGIKGIGIESTCIHLDVRPDEKCSSQDEFGKYCIFNWVDDGTEYGKSTVIY